jgi:hypothetical protein
MSEPLERFTGTLPTRIASDLKADIEKGLENVAANQIKPFDLIGIIEKGKKLLVARAKKINTPTKD